jgi:hypothetical protein
MQGQVQKLPVKASRHKIFYMKKSTLYLSGLLIAGSCTLFSCQKTDVVPDEIISGKGKKEACVATAFRFTAQNETGAFSQYVFRKEFTGNEVSRITAGIYNGGTITSTASFDVKWAPGQVYFLRSGSATDTVLVVALNSSGKATSVRAGNAADPNYLPTTFEYSNSRLSKMNITLAGRQLSSNFIYDDKGNNTSIQDVAQGSEVPGRMEFTYSNRKANNGQLYLDEPRIFSWNTFSLLQYAGMFPELTSDRLRTGVKVWWANNYKAYDAQLVNHQVDKGRLVKYDVTFAGSTVAIPYYVDWQCSQTEED